MGIEIGKKYEIIRSAAGNDGSVVTVIGKAEDDHSFAIPTDRWLIDTELRTLHGHTVNHAPASNLKPIDDDDSRKAVSWEGLKDIWVPPLVAA